MRSALASLALVALLAGCGSSLPSPAPAAAVAPPAPRYTGMVAGVAAPEADVRVMTLTAVSPSAMTLRGRWFRRAGNGWEQADCEISRVSDPRAGQPAPAECTAFTAVAGDGFAAIAKARAYGDAIACKDQPAICAELGLQDQTATWGPPGR